MNLSINENIKKLRKDKNITQEKLAEHLSVSIQAVSKWERGETFPDITMILPIASYFGVSTDELLGVDAAKSEARIQAHLNKMEELELQGKWHEMIELSAKAYKEFSNDFRIMHEYSTIIIGGRADHSTENILAHADEVSYICERILAECNIDNIRNEALVTMSRVDKARGNADKALESLARLPDWFTTRGQVSEQLFDKKSGEWWNYIIANFFELADFALNKLQKIIWYSEKPFDEKVKAAHRTIDYLLKIFDETDCELLYNFISLAYNEIGCWHHREGKSEEVGKYFDIGLSYAMKFDDFVASDRQFPFHSQKSKQNYNDMWNNFEKYNTMLKRQFAWYENNSWFEEARKHESFMAMLEKYKPFAKD